MSDKHAPFRDTDAELREADLLLDKADALLRRHKGSDTPTRETDMSFNDIPILTDVIEDFGMLPPLDTTTAKPSASAPTPHVPDSAESIELVEYLISLDTEIAREIEAWFARELPQIVERELERLSVRLREEMTAHVKATLLPSLSERISEKLAQIPRIKR